MDGSAICKIQASVSENVKFKLVHISWVLNFFEVEVSAETVLKKCMNYLISISLEDRSSQTEKRSNRISR